jgi:hypothetical protein
LEADLLIRVCEELKTETETGSGLHNCIFNRNR